MLGAGLGVEAEPPGVVLGVGEKTGVEVNVGVGKAPRTLRLVPTEGRGVSTLSPLETRAVHSSAVCPTSKPLTSKVNAGPLVAARLPLLPAIAIINPLCELLIADAESAPKRFAIAMLLTSIKFA